MFLKLYFKMIKYTCNFDIGNACDQLSNRLIFMDAVLQEFITSSTNKVQLEILENCKQFGEKYLNDLVCFNIL